MEDHADQEDDIYYEAGATDEAAAQAVAQAHALHDAMDVEIKQGAVFLRRCLTDKQEHMVL